MELLIIRIGHCDMIRFTGKGDDRIQIMPVRCQEEVFLLPLRFPSDKRPRVAADALGMLYACRLQMNRKRIAKLNGNTTMPGSDNHLHTS